MTWNNYLHEVRIYRERTRDWLGQSERGAETLQNAILAAVSITIAVGLGALLVAAFNNRSSGIQ